LGIDPHLHELPRFFSELLVRYGSADGISRWVQQLLEISAPHIAAVKFQSAFFEALGWQGWRSLQDLCATSRRLGLLSIFDGKRGDIGSTMHAYGTAAFEQLQVDSMTVQAYIGPEVITALKPWLQKDRGIYLLWLSSNPQIGWVQQHRSSQGSTLAEDLLSPLQELLSKEDLVDSCGLVLGATRVDELGSTCFSRALEFPLLVPGLGEQEGKVDAPRLRQLQGVGRGHLFPMSRGLTGIGSRQWVETFSQMTLQEYFSWYEKHLASVVITPQQVS
jgi:orotidine-5'-phosphate decarboxylase